MSLDDHYYHLADGILEYGEDSEDRTGTGTRRRFGTRLFYLARPTEFPILTTKYISFKAVYDELKWFYSGSTKVSDLPKHIQHWWKPFADESGDIGHSYGKNLRTFPDYQYPGITHDQLGGVLRSLTENTTSRRHIMSTWNPGSVPDLTLPPCHGLVIQFYVTKFGQLRMQTYQRSADVFLGLPINLSHYALLLNMVAFSTGLDPHSIVYIIGDTHIYNDHIPLITEQLSREHYEPPGLFINAKKYNDPLETFLNIEFSDLELVGYKSHPKIKGNMSV